ncbi:bZIP transcription factor crc isoform X2 [Lycorma delicatula]|uniref:bZIP transcription factor crc isoform X2 n=1 Tax=Lycorma delicatula TaxID=130591 RepID=UPI003F50F6C6
MFSVLTQAIAEQNFYHINDNNSCSNIYSPLQALNRRTQPNLEPFSDWYEEKIELPIFEELETVPPLPAAAALPPPPPQQRKDVQAYNKEFIDVCPYDSTIHNMEGKVHIPNMVVLPEQRPPQQQPHHQHNIHQPHSIVTSTPIVVPMQLGEQTSTLMQEFEFVLSNHETLTPPESPRDDGMGLTMLQDMRTEELDELVRIRVESLVEGPDNSCSSSLHEDSTADSPASSDSGYDDPDWTPEPIVSENPKQGKRRRLTKPYSRAPPEEKRQRKKEQNKNAATRYRLKKKAEIEEILGEERELQDKNEKLKTDLSELAREIKYLKNLMRDVFKAKGLIK